ncbi:MAG: ABC transporter permease [Chloroflexi bacterium]|nr:ABC transporter permease [Chloroflexota bacterium]
MQRYILGRVLQLLLAVFAITVLVFAVARLSGDVLRIMMPIEATQEDFEQMAAYLGMDKPLVQQYAVWIGHVFKGDLGTSLKTRVPVTTLLRQRLPNSVKLASFTLVVGLTLALLLGVGSAVYRGSVFDGICRFVAVAGMSFPQFWVGIMAILLFAVRFQLLPASGTGGIDHYILPGLIMGWAMSAPMMRLLRSSMLEVLDSEYVKLARIKGVSEWATIWRHALRNALIPLVTFAGFYLGLLVSGVVIIETVFVWPGVGLLAYEGILWRDYPVIQAVVLIVSVSILTVNLAVDVLYAYLDPRIRY